MKTENYLSDLLYRHQYVIVPNFGAFIAESVSARIDEETMRIVPPSKSIAFNRLLQTNDGLLINHISNEQNCSYQEAKNWVSNEIEQWNLLLRNEKKLLLNGIGQFELTEEEKIIFFPSNDVNYLTSSFGLQSAVANQIIREVEEKTSTTAEKKAIRKISYGWMKYAAAAIVGVSALGFSWKYQQEQAIYQQKKMALQKEVQSEVLNEIQEATFYLEAPKSKDKTTTNQKVLPFHIIAAAFKTENKAERYAEKLKHDGFTKAHYIPKSDANNMIMVVYESFANEEDALVALSNIKKKNLEAWIFIQN